MQISIRENDIKVKGCIFCALNKWVSYMSC